jgi:hypothetical protein
MKNILVFPCGSEIGLEIYRSLENSKHFKLFGGSSVEDHGKFVYKNYIPNLPSVDEKNFISQVNQICDKFEIDFIIPAHDSVVLKLAENEELLKSKILTSCYETCKICRSKLKTYLFFDKIIPTPIVYNKKENYVFPLFLKPEVGQGSKGTFKVNTKEELNFYLKKDPTLLILEFLPGKEYTVDCFTDKNGKLLFAEGRERVRINNGISFNTIPIQDESFLEMAKKINDNLSFRGAWFFQVKGRENKEKVLMEISPRIAGTMDLFRVKGVNFVLLGLHDMLNQEVKIINNNFGIELDRALSNKFKIDYDYESIYIDLDDTIIVNNQVNINVIKFLYQAKNENKKIILITRHIKNINKTLKKNFLSKKIFNEIISVKNNQNKSNFIKNEMAIFIDDSFKERHDVLKNCKIPVFDLDAVEALIR